MQKTSPTKKIITKCTVTTFRDLISPGDFVFNYNNQTNIMTTKKFQPRNWVLMIIILLIAAIRVFNNFSSNITVLANYSPLAAMALFGGAYFKGKLQPFLFPLFALLISDVILFATVYKQYGNGFLYGGWYWVYGAFILMVLVSRLIISKIKLQNVALAIVVAVFIHWIVTDFPVWLYGTTYPRTWSGFNACMLAAIPFELRLLIATIGYGAIMFGGFELMKKKFPALQLV
jgi:hypothetical protein